ncbi:uncharacterized protein BCR38DRAFT_444608 [Pseudomassariella vexata]|uniref:Uncharacterized protein n=1 Tax=Pseudomassariella vexata TaxID=1141098 RepID=A0A1Y2DJP1_9PEZI|nr:uncharacterized protein BCR38DRAFT_444608 [Pseudomassariella vexata]ORY59467.1 hypothetical protein BCR38DRAFT_444608 [Pseudomassariella vexata]
MDVCKVGLCLTPQKDHLPTTSIEANRSEIFPTNRGLGYSTRGKGRLMTRMYKEIEVKWSGVKGVRVTSWGMHGQTKMGKLGKEMAAHGDWAKLLGAEGELRQ